MLSSLLFLGVFTAVALAGRPMLTSNFGVVFTDFQFAMLFCTSAMALLYRRRVMSR